MTDLWVVQLGRIPYRDAYALQEQVRAARQEDRIPDTLLQLEHPPVYTRGRRTGPGELPLDTGIEVVDVDRGGKVTYHGPGQLVGYPIMRTDDVLRFVRTMEGAIVAALAAAGVEARTRTDEGADYTGVWVGDAKIASIGVHVSRGVTTHGYAVNVENDLTPFDWIVPCGLPGVRMTTVGTEGLACFRKRMAFAFAEAHGLRQRLVSETRLRAALSPAAPLPSVA